MGGLRTLLAWLAFLGCLFGGAALLLSDDGLHQAIGLTLILAPVLVLVYLTLAHYARQRRQARP